MSKTLFIKFVSDPDQDTMKAIVGLACAAQAVSDGHQVNVFFAAAGVRLLEASYLARLDAEMGGEQAMVTSFMHKLMEGAHLSCSLGSVKAVLGHAEGDGNLIMADADIAWSGPPGVVQLAVNSEVQLTY